MKHTIIFILMIFLSSTINSLPIKNRQPKVKCSCALTYKIEAWRRLGDNMLTYAKAKLLSLAYNLPLLCKPFPYSDQFVLHTKETFITPEIEKQFDEVVEIFTLQQLEQVVASGKSLLLEINFLTETPWLYSYSRQNVEFEKILKQMLLPTIEIEPLPKPANVVTVALHIRKGGGYDMPLGSAQQYDIDNIQVEGIHLKKNSPGNSCTDFWPIKWPLGPKYIDEVRKFAHRKTHLSDYVWPIKFPPDQYYIDQIKELIKIIPDRHLLIYLFTDDPNPQEIMQIYNQALSDYPRIIFSYRSTGNHHNKNVLQDLFSIIDCDCLISAHSSFSNAAQLLGNHSIILMPVHALTFPDKIFIDKVAIFGMNNALDLEKRHIFYNEKVYEFK